MQCVGGRSLLAIGRCSCNLEGAPGPTTQAPVDHVPAANTRRGEAACTPVREETCPGQVRGLKASALGPGTEVTWAARAKGVTPCSFGKPFMWSPTSFAYGPLRRGSRIWATNEHPDLESSFLPLAGGMRGSLRIFGEMMSAIATLCWLGTRRFSRPKLVCARQA